MSVRPDIDGRPPDRMLPRWLLCSSQLRMTIAQSSPKTFLKHLTARQPTRDQTVGREIGYDLATFLGHHDLFLDTCRTRAVLGALPGLEREHHAFLQGRVLASVTLGY